MAHPLIYRQKTGSNGVYCCSIIWLSRDVQLRVISITMETYIVFSNDVPSGSMYSENNNGPQNGRMAEWKAAPLCNPKADVMFLRHMISKPDIKRSPFDVLYVLNQFNTESESPTNFSRR